MSIRKLHWEYDSFGQWVEGPQYPHQKVCEVDIPDSLWAWYRRAIDELEEADARIRAAMEEANRKRGEITR